MKIIALLISLIFCQLSTEGQENIASEYGLDTLFSNHESCEKGPIYEYFTYHTKYPESSMSLLKKVRDRIALHHITLSKNGFITFRFTINCQGQVSCFKLYLLDENYAETKFDKQLILFLYDFIKGLKDWKIIKDKSGQLISNYNSYISFQIKNGEIISLAP